MFSGFKKVSIAAGAAVFALGVLPNSFATAAAIQNTSPATIDGWNISWGTGVGLTVTQDTNSNQVDVEKSATFTAPNQGYQITFAPVPGSTGTSASEFVIPDETIVNNSGSAFSSFSFILINKSSTLATFDSVARTFIPPTGSGYDYTSVSLTSGNTILTYTGTQGNGITSFWGNGDPSASGDNLLIDAPAGSDFALKELSASGPGGSPGGPGSVVPLPAAASQSLAGLVGLALIGLRRQLKRRRLA
jgi:hypothetical protein